LEKLKGILRAVNVAICLVVILCLLYVLVHVAFIIPLALLIILQFFVFAGFIAFEVDKSRTLARHAIVFVLILTTIGVGLFCTMSLMSAYAPRRSKPLKQSESTIPQTKTGGLSAARFNFASRRDQITICRNGG
jgi:hypothetical protein